ncbi:MAG TPA: rhodanese-like domain-containing protein [Steroidobacteraceae bacterium]|nr:rhodanese-like domain-containing protein [Steroidobacteraceae bacterium]
MCGVNPSIREPQDLAPTCSLEELESLRRVQAKELPQWLDGTERIIDVRGRDEYAVSHLPGAKNIPLDELGGRLHELAGAARVLFVCRSGTRSLAACQLAIASGIDTPAHLEGGLLAWSQEMEADFVVAPV